MVSKFRRLKKGIKAISLILAVLMMIVIAVSAGLMAYVWVMEYIDFTTSKAGQSIQIQSCSTLNLQ